MTLKKSKYKSMKMHEKVRVVKKSTTCMFSLQLPRSPKRLVKELLPLEFKDNERTHTI